MASTKFSKPVDEEIASLSEQIGTIGNTLSQKSNLLIVEEKQTGGSGSISAGANKKITVSVSKSGYTPIGIVGWWGSSDSFIAVEEVFLSGSDANIYVRNVSSSSDSINYIRFQVLYVKN